MARRAKVQTPDGRTIEVEVPDDATDDEVIGFVQEQLKSRGSKFAGGPTRVRHTGVIEGASKGDLGNVFLQGATAGFSDEAMGVLGAGVDAIAAPFSSNIDFDPVSSYQAYRDDERRVLSEQRKGSPWASTLAELTGGIVTGGTAAQGALQGPAGARSVLQQAKAGGKAGAALGALSGFGYGEGLSNSIAAAGLGAALGGPLGAALPLAIAPLAKTAQTVTDFLRPRNGLARDIFVKAAVDDGLAPSQIGQRIGAAHQRGSPLAPIDLGDNLRGLGGAVSRAPGASRRLVRTMLTNRQAGQGERIRGAIERDLGPIGNVDQLSDDLMARANAAAGPAYDAARANPVISTPELEAVLATPAGRRALSEARTIAANERRDPEALGFVLGEDGNVSLNPTLNIADDGSIVQEAARQRGYTLDTLDLVKRGLDAILEPNRNPVTRRLDLAGNPLAQSQDTVRKQLVREVDRVNPDYAAARAAFAEPASMRTALEQGEKMTGATAEELARATARMTPAQQAQFALGYRSRLGEDLNRRVVNGDKVGALLGTPRKQQALGQLFGGEANFPRFADTLGDEALANETFRSVMTGSPTANRLADDATVGDAALLQELAGSAIKGAERGGITGALAGALGTVKHINRFGAGKTGERTREELAALISEIDPTLLAQSWKDSTRQAATRRVGQRANARRIRNAGMFGARGLGAVSGYTLRPIDE